MGSSVKKRRRVRAGDGEDRSRFPLASLVARWMGLLWVVSRDGNRQSD